MADALPPPRPLKLLAAAGAAGAAGFLLILADVLAGGALARLDRSVEAALEELLGGARPGIVVVGSIPGDAPVVAALLAGGTLACLLWRRPLHAALTAGVGIASYLLVPALKAWVGRMRPPGGGGLESLAFPSGHAAQATVAWGLLWLALDAATNGELHPAVRRAAWAVWIVAAASAGAARVLGGVHWASDVLAGWCLGAALVAGALLAARAAPNGGGGAGARRERDP